MQEEGGIEMNEDISKQVEEYLARGGSMQVIPPGISSNTPTPKQKKDTDARKKAQKELTSKPRHNRGGGKKAKSGHQNIVEHNTCWSFNLNTKYVKSFRFNGDKEKALQEAIEYRDRYRRLHDWPKADY